MIAPKYPRQRLYTKDVYRKHRACINHDARRNARRSPLNRVPARCEPRPIFREEKKDHDIIRGGENRGPRAGGCGSRSGVENPHNFSHPAELVDRPLHFQRARHVSMKCTIIGMFLTSVLFVRVMTFSPDIFCISTINSKERKEDKPI